MWIEYEFEDLFGAAAVDGKADVVDFVECRCSTVRAAPVADNRFDDVAILDFCVGLPEASPIFVTTIFVAHLLDYYHSLHSWLRKNKYKQKIEEHKINSRQFKYV